jgi:tRNA threonylcarbamoyladenosine biosynthesis protein TsaE
MNTFYYYTNSPEETEAFAIQLAKKLRPKDVITLEGDLGAGKTTFTKGLAKGLGIQRTVKSPTFTIIKEYQGFIPLFHMDVYRLENSEEDLGFEEYFDGGGVTVVEWAQFIRDRLPDQCLVIEIYNRGETERELRLKPVGERFVGLCEELME